MGHYVPSARITNDYFEKINGLTSDWIVQRTGIHSRSKAAADENSDSMALAAIDDVYHERNLSKTFHSVEELMEDLNT